MMSFKTNRHWALCLWVFLSCSNIAFAHTLDDTSAHVILRDGQVEVRITTNSEHLLSSLQSEQAWLLGDIPTLMEANLTPTQQAEFIKNFMQNSTTIELNQAPIAIEHVVIDNDVKSNKGETNITIVCFARHQFSSVSQAGIRLARVLGPVHVRFTQPQYRMVGAGNMAQAKFP
jgi:hypothetical protein